MKTAEDIIRTKNRPLVSTPAKTPLLDVIRLMNEQKIGSILVEDNDTIVGIWTERDLLEDVLKPGFAIDRATVGECMSTQLCTSPATDSVYKLMDAFLGLRLRHILIEKEGKYVGILSSGDVMKAALLQKNHELAELNASTSWDYYEEWKQA